MSATATPTCWRSPTGSSPRPRPGEQVEAFVSRGGETDVRVYEGEVEHFVAAQSEGIGIRVIRDGRTGFAYAGTLDDAAIAEVLAEARDNVAVRHRRRVGRPRRARRCRRHRAAAVERRARRRSPTDAQDRAGQGARAAHARRRPAGPRRRLQLRRRLRRGGRRHHHRHPPVRVARTAATCSVSTLADDGDETQTGFGFSVGRSPDEFDLDKAAQRGRRPGDPPARRHQAAVAGALTVVLDPFVTAQFLGIISVDAQRREPSSRAAACSRDRLGEQVAAPLVTLVDDPDEPARLHRHRRRRRGARGAPQRADRRAACCSSSCTTRTRARRAGTGRTGNAVRGGFTGTPGVGCLALQLRARHAIQAELDRRHRRRPARAERAPACTPASTRSAATSPPALPGC